MLRIVVGDVDRMTVVRDDELTLIVRPLAMDRDQSIAEGPLLLTPEELAILRASYCVSARGDALVRWRDVTPDVICPCYIARQLRIPEMDEGCALHADLTMALS